MYYLLLPIYSARSRANGKYLLQADGNLAMALHTKCQEANGWHDAWTLGIPDKHQLADGELAWLKAIVPNIKLMHFGYGKNIAETRATFWQNNELPIGCKALVTGIAGFEQQHSAMLAKLYGYELLLNASRQSSVRQPCDANWDADLASAKIADTVHVLDAGQAGELIRNGVDSRSVLIGHYRQLNAKLFDAIGYVKPQLADVYKPETTLIASFKLSDAEHKAKLSRASAYANSRGLRLLATDPTNCFNECEQIDGTLAIAKHIAKAELYWLARYGYSFVGYGHPSIYHPGLAELAFLGSPIVEI